MSQQIFPQLQALLHATADALAEVKPTVTFSELPDNIVKFWKVNYPKGQGKAKADFLMVVLNKFMADNNVFIDVDGRVKPIPNEKKG